MNNLTNKSEFGSEKVDFTKASLIYNIKSIKADIDEVLKKLKKIYEDSINIEDENEYQRVQSKLRAEIKNFRLMNNLCDEFCDSIDELMPVSTNKPTENFISEKENTYNKTAESNVKASVDDENTKILDFIKPYDCTGCKPVSYTYCNAKYLAESWKDVYQGFLRLICQNNSYEKILKNLSGTALNGRNIDFADSALKNQMRIPVEISDGLYVESNLTANHIVKNIVSILRLCAIDYNSLKIEYINHEAVSSGKLKENTRLKTVEINANQIGSKGYINHMVSQGVKYKTAQWYESAIRKCNEYAHNNNLYTGSIFDDVTMEGFKLKYDALMKNEDFISLNKMKHGVYSAALNKYEKYLKEMLLG